VTQIADTGLLVGFLDASDQYHAWAKGQFARMRGNLVTCEAVLAEAEYLVPGSGPRLMEMVRRGTLHVEHLLPSDAQSLATLMTKYPKMQLADACIVRLSEILPKAVVYTTDKRDFSVYRRRGKEAIDTITP
jgi:predicted nucleic acid-binding protein